MWVVYKQNYLIQRWDANLYDPTELNEGIRLTRQINGTGVSPADEV